MREQQASGETDPLVSVIMPNFNRADLVLESLKSVSGQTMAQWECIVVDDGSTDDSPAVIASYAARDPRVRLMRRDRSPKGACTCRNIGVADARGRYVLFLDSDDLLAPHCLDQRTAVLEGRPDLDFAVFPMLLFEGDPATATRLWNVETNEDDFGRLLRSDPICQTTGTLWRREAFTRLGKWSESLEMWQDIELHMRAFSGEWKYVRCLDIVPDVYIRETGGSLSRGGYYLRPKLESRAAVVRRAVEILRATGRTDLLTDVRYMCGTVVLEAVASGNLGMARSLWRWGRRERVLTREDALTLAVAAAAGISRLDRLTAVRKIRNRVADSFNAAGTLGRVVYKGEARAPAGEMRPA